MGGEVSAYPAGSVKYYIDENDVVTAVAIRTDFPETFPDMAWLAVYRDGRGAKYKDDASVSTWTDWEQA